MQVFAFLALMSGVLSAHAQWTSPARLAPPPAPEKAAANAAPPAVGPGAAASRAPDFSETSSALTPAPGAAIAPMLAPALEPAAPALPAGVVARSLKSRVPGLWVVDAAGGRDADAAALSDVLAGAKDGDVVFVRPGVYTGKIMVAGSVTLRGTGKNREDVVVVADDAQTASVGRGRARFEHLTLINRGPRSATVAAVSGGSLDLVDVAIQSQQGQGLRVTAGAVDARDSLFVGRIAVIVDAAGRATLTGGEVRGSDVGALVTGDGSAAEFIKTRFIDGMRQLVIQSKARANVNGGAFQFTRGPIRDGAVVALSGSKVLLGGARIDLARAAKFGIVARDSTVAAARMNISGGVGNAVEMGFGGGLTLTDSTIEDNAGGGVIVVESKATLKRTTVRRSGAGVGMIGRANVEANGCRFENNRLGSLVVGRGDENLVTLSGTGNVGAEMNRAGLHLVAKTVRTPNSAPPGAASAPPGSGPGPDANAGASAQANSAVRSAASNAEAYDPESKPVLLR